MDPNNKPTEHQVAYGAAAEGVIAAIASVGVIGRYWWNLQMRFLVTTGAMRFFRAHWWLFLIAGFLLLAFAMPLGVAFMVSAYCASTMDPSPDEDFIVPLRRAANVAMDDDVDTGKYEVPDARMPDKLEQVRVAASTHHFAYINAIQRDLEDKEIAAAALGVFDGTVQAFGVKLSDLDMHTNGAAFIAAQLISLERVDKSNPDPDTIAEVTEEAMQSENLEGIRTEAGHFAYTMGRAMQNGPDLHSN